MTKRVEAKHKIDRRLRCNLWGRPKSPFNRREHPPGQHGQSRRRKVSDYGNQLMAKQKLKGYYGNITETQFRNIYQKAVQTKGNTAANLIALLERRLDAVIYRMKYVPTVFAARQFINHGHVLVNGTRVNIPSYRLNDGDVVEVHKRACQLPMVLDAMVSSERDIPEYITVNVEQMNGTFVRPPAMNEVPYPTAIEPNLVIEFYSR